MEIKQLKNLKRERTANAVHAACCHRIYSKRRSRRFQVMGLVVAALGFACCVAYHRQPYPWEQQQPHHGMLAGNFVPSVMSATTASAASSLHYLVQTPSRQRNEIRARSMSPISSVPFSLKVTTVSGGSRSSTVTARAKKKKEGKKIEKFESEEDRLKNFVLPEGDQQLRENLRATAEERIKQVIGEQEELGDVMTPEGFQKLKEKIQKESEEMLNKSFDEAKEKIRSNFNERLDAIEAQRREQQQKNLEMIAEMKRQDDEEMDRLYRENIEPLKKDRAEMQRLVDELREEEQSSKRNVGLFFQNLYGAPTPRKERALRPQSAESGKLKFLEENASDAKELGKATRTAIEDLQTKAEMQAEPFKRAAYSVIGAIVVLNVAKWILEHNPFQ